MKISSVIILLLLGILHQTFGYTIKSSDTEYDIIDIERPGRVQFENDDLDEIGRSRRRVDYDRDVVFSPEYGLGYYIFPRSRRNDRRDYRPIARYQSTQTNKRKKLFVPNLFG